MSTDRLALLSALRRYGERRPDEPDVGRCVTWLERDERPFQRESLEGHFTGSAWLVSRDGARVLLMLHAKLGRWLQPGGHADGDPDLAAVALREAEEETGLRGLTVRREIFDVDAHRIPARGHEPEHWHYDVRYVVVAGVDDACVANAESLSLAWVPIVDLAHDKNVDPSLRRMASKWLADGSASTMA